MKGASTAIAVLSFVTSVFAGAQVPTVPVGSTTTTSQATTATFAASPVQTTAVNGIINVPALTGSTVYPRLEVRQMQSQQPNQWTLFLLAMRNWQLEQQNSPSSYYSVAGIHGVPHNSYNNVGQCNNCGGADGYCPHNSIHFPAWHRVYIAFYEQQLLARVKAVAKSYTGSQQNVMIQAASTMRLPYWDWAAQPPSGSSVLPNSLTDSAVTVNGPSGTVSIPNPLAQFNYQDASGMYYSPFTDYKTTVRYPTTGNSQATSQQNQAISAFTNAQPSLQDQVFSLFTQCNDYSHFSNDAADSSSTQCSNSLEGIHNTVHMTAGGQGSSSAPGGHMTYLPLASFDPVFWLHHANVDRIFAMWQTINPNAYGGSQNAVDSTWTIAQGSYQDSNSPLTPFYKDGQNFWTTNQVKDWASTFAYTYPEFSNSKGDKAAITNYVNALYGKSATAKAGSSKRSVRQLARVAETWEAEPILRGRTGAYANPLAASNGSTFEWFANIQTPRYYLGGSFTVYLFLGEPESEDPTTWAHDCNLVGPMGVMAEVKASGMAEVVVAGSVPLTRALGNLVGQGLDTLSTAHTGPFLKEHLVWRVAGPEGCSVDPSTIPNFAVSVVSSTATVPTCGEELPTFSPFQTLVNVTAGVAGGLNATTTLLGDTFSAVEKAVDTVTDDVAKTVSGLVNGGW